MKYYSLLIAAVLLTACGQHKAEKPDVFGTMDSTAIAKDTTVEHQIENSYEYSKTINLYPNTALDVIGFRDDKLKDKVAILLRTNTTSRDTVYVGERNGIVLDALAGEVNDNTMPEIFIVTKEKGTENRLKLRVVELNLESKKAEFIASIEPPVNKDAEYNGRDTFYLEGNKLVQQYPGYDQHTSLFNAELKKLYYVLNGQKLLLFDQIDGDKRSSK